MAAARNQLDAMDQLLGLWAIEKEGVRLDSFVREPAAAGLFPGQALVEQRDLEAGSRQPFAARRPRRAAPDYGYFPHRHTPLGRLARSSPADAFVRKSFTSARTR